MATHIETRHLPQVMETIFVGSAMKEVSDEIMDKDVPVRARHMRSIDDLLMHVEDNHVQCAVVDQSLPTESRGVKLVLLAGVNKVKHLIVVASPKSRTEIASIDGVHTVLCSPASREQIVEAMLGQTRQNEPATVAATSNTLAAQAVMRERAQPGASMKFAKYLLDIAAETAHKSSMYSLPRLSSHLTTRPAMATVACLFAGLGTIAALSAASLNSVTPVELVAKPAIVKPSQIGSGETAKQPYGATQSSGQTTSALEAAGLSRRAAESRLQASLRTIDLEILQQRGLRQELLAHITRLNAIVADLNSARDENSSRQTGRPTSMKTHMRLAEVKIELALQELELSKTNNILSNLDLLKSQINPPEKQALKLADIRSTGISN